MVDSENTPKSHMFIGGCCLMQTSNALSRQVLVQLPLEPQQVLKPEMAQTLVTHAPHSAAVSPAPVAHGECSQPAVAAHSVKLVVVGHSTEFVSEYAAVKLGVVSPSS